MLRCLLKRRDVDDVLRVFSVFNRAQAFRVLTFGRVDHLRIDCRGDDGQGEILQVPAQTVTQDRELQLIQVC